MKELMNRFRQKKILIIGDLMLDTYLKGEVTRVSSEAPVPVIKIENEYHDIGGAGNVAANIVSLGGHATLFSFVGDDHAGIILKNLLLKERIESRHDNRFRLRKRRDKRRHNEHHLRIQKQNNNRPKTGKQRTLQKCV